MARTHAVSASGYWLWDYGEQRVAARWLLRVLASVAFFGAWEIVGRSGRIFAIVPFTEVVGDLWEQLRSGELWEPTFATLKVALVGFAISAVIGIAVGVAVGMSRPAKAAIDPILNFGLSAPMTMLVPVLSIYVGLEFQAKVTFVVLLSVFMIAVNTSAGVAETPLDLDEMVTAFGIRGPRRYLRLVFPNALPSILTGLRLGLGQAITAAIIADLLLLVGGLSGLLIRAGARLDMTRLLSVTFFTVLIGSGLMVLARAAERRILRWLYV